MASYRVLSISNPEGVTTHEFISHIGYYESKEIPMVIIPVAETVARIEANPEEFDVQTARYPKVYVEVVRTIARRPFLKTITDFLQKDLLLSLEHITAV